MKKLQITLLSVVLLACSIQSSFSQSGITIEASQMITNFAFTNSDAVLENSYFILNQESEYRPVYSGAYQVGYSYMLDMGLFFNASIGMRKSGATMVYDNTNYLWNLQYAQGKLGLGYGYTMGIFMPYLSTSGYYGFLLKANQSINNENFDILNSGSIAKNDFGLYISPGLRINASDFVSVFMELSYMMGMQNIETGDTGQEAKNLANALTLGVIFNIQ